MSTPSIVPLHIFRFRVDVTDDSLSQGPQGSAVQMSFAECTGLEATMEPKTIKEGGRNYGAAQRAGGITFATVVLKRGVSTDRGMWQIFNAVASGQFAPRLQVTVTLLDGSQQAIMALATRPCDAGEIQIRGPERPRHGGRHRGIALRSRRAFRSLKENSR